MGQFVRELSEKDAPVPEEDVFAVENVRDQPRDAARLHGQRLHPFRMPRRNDQGRLVAGHAHGPDRQDLRDEARPADVAPRVRRQGPQQGRERIGLAQDGLAVEADADEVVQRLRVVGLEGVPGRAQLGPLLRREAAVRRELVDAALDLGPEAPQLARLRDQRTGVARIGRLQGRGVEQGDALDAPLLADQAPRNLGASDGALFLEAPHVVEQGKADRLRTEHPDELGLFENRLAGADLLDQRDLEFDLNRRLGQRRATLELVPADLLLAGAERRVVEQGIGQVSGPHLRDAPFDARAHQLLEPAIHGGEVGSDVAVEALAPLGAALGHGEAQNHLALRLPGPDRQPMGRAREAFEEIVAFDRLAENDLLPARVKLLVPLQMAAVELEELLVLLVPVRPLLARPKLLEMLAPHGVEDVRIVAVVVEEIQGRLREPLLALARLLEHEMDAVQLPFELRDLRHGRRVARLGRDERLQSDSGVVRDRLGVVSQSLGQLLGVDGLPVRAHLRQQRRAVRKELLERLAPRAGGLAVGLRAGEQRGVAGKAGMGQSPAQRLADRQPAGVGRLAGLRAELAELVEGQVGGGH